MQARSSLILFSLFIILCSTYASGKVITGAERMDQYLPLIKGKRVGMVVNHTSIVGTEQIHLLDTLLNRYTVLFDFIMMSLDYLISNERIFIL